MAIIAGKPYLLQCLFRIHASAVLTQFWHRAKMLPDLSLSLAHALKYYQELNDPQHQALQAFWAHFHDTSQLELLLDKLKQVVELISIARSVMEATFLSLWP